VRPLRILNLLIDTIVEHRATVVGLRRGETLRPLTRRGAHRGRRTTVGQRDPPLELRSTGTTTGTGRDQEPDHR
jgi:hypothetical protein